MSKPFSSNQRHSYLGTRIAMHRALRHEKRGLFFWLSFLLLPVLTTWLQIQLWPTIQQFWHHQFLFWPEKIGLSLDIAVRHSNIPWLGEITSPYISSLLPTLTQWWFGNGITLLLFLISFRLSDALLPIRYVLRFIALIQASAQLYFLFYAASYPYNATNYLSDVVELAALLWLIAPTVLALIYLPLVQSIRRYCVLIFLVAGYLILLTPFQYTMHAWILTHCSMLYHPLLYLLGTLLPQIMGVISLYAWALTWQTHRQAH